MCVNLGPFVLWVECGLKVFENKVLRRIFFYLREKKLTEEWRMLRNEEVHNLCSSPDIIRVIKGRGMRQVGCVAYIGEMINAYRILTQKPDALKILFGGCSINGGIKLEWFLQK
jgi:hypothetical protein